MVDRGNCTFVTKARNVQNIGGHIALIIDNVARIEDITGYILTDDGTGQDVWIHAVLISQKDGDIIKSFIRDKEYNPRISDDIIISIEYEMVLNVKLAKIKHS